MKKEEQNLEETIKNLESAIYQRKSTRSFENKNISKADRQKLEEFIKNIPSFVPFQSSANILLGPEDNQKTIFLINVTSAFAAIISNDTVMGQAQAGFTGELFVLYCQSIGISTCWIGSFRRNQAESIISGRFPGYNHTDKQFTGSNNSAKKVLCLVALGYNSRDNGFLNKVTKKMFSSKRRSIEESLSGDSLKDFPENIKYGLELAARAPSARNRQYWYFKVSQTGKHDTSAAGYNEDGYIVEIGRRKEQGSIGWPYPDLDVGIASSHFWLGLQSRSIASKVNIKEEGGRSLWEFSI